jgi:hypothetical protein
MHACCRMHSHAAKQEARSKPREKETAACAGATEDRRMDIASESVQHASRRCEDWMRFLIAYAKGASGPIDQQVRYAH